MVDQVDEVSDIKLDVPGTQVGLTESSVVLCIT